MRPATSKNMVGLTPRERECFFSSLLLAQLLALVLLLLAPGVSVSQKIEQREKPRRAAPHEEVSPADIVRIDTDLVPVEVTVIDAKGQSIRGLGVRDFKLYADDVEQPISFFAAETLSGGVLWPLDLIFALDVSGSMKSAELELLRHAATAFRESLSEQGPRFAVISFGMRVKVLQSFTDDQRKLDKAFAQAVRDGMGLSTHAFDAVDDAVRLFVRSGRRTSAGKLVKRVVVVISDGFPTGDTVSPRTVIERANAANVNVFTVTMPSFSVGYQGTYAKPLPTILDVSGLVEETGGISVYATDKNYTQALKAIGENVLSRYLLAFYPAKDKRRDGNFHKLRIEVREGLQVKQGRAGYVARDWQ